MTEQVVPIENIAAVGIIRDAPAVGLPPNAFSDARNVRFDDNAIRKMKGHEALFTNLSWTNIQHINFWDNPNEPVYLVIDRETDSDRAYFVTISSAGIAEKDKRYGTSDRTGNWDSTIFNGGYSIIINNGVETPQYISDVNTGTLTVANFEELPGWQSYAIDSDQNTRDSEIAAGDVRVTARIITAFGNLLMAGGLQETDSDGVVVRELGGVVRSSSIAPLGQIPTNWNPFAIGAGTADELLLADTGAITAMKPLQGRMFVFTADSIHSVEVTNAGLRTFPVTTQYGALSQDAVFEFDGKFLIVGSNDIYVFGGHPGDIQSVSDNRVRRYFYDNLNPLTSERIFIRRNQTYDEIWINYPSVNSATGNADEALIYNVRNQTWTRRELPDVTSGVQAPLNGGGAPDSVLQFSADELSGNTGALNNGRQEVQTLQVQNSIRGPHSGTAQVQSFNVPAVTPFDTADINLFDLEIKGGTGPNTVNAVNTITLPTFSFTFGSNLINGGALLTLTDNVATYNISASALSGLSGSTNQTAFAAAVAAYMDSDNITGFDWSASANGAVITLTSDGPGPRTFTTATLTTYTGQSATITGSQSSTDDGNSLRLTRVSTNFTHSLANAVVDGSGNSIADVDGNQSRLTFDGAHNSNAAQITGTVNFTESVTITPSPDFVFGGSGNSGAINDDTYCIFRSSGGTDYTFWDGGVSATLTRFSTTYTIPTTGFYRISGFADADNPDRDNGSVVIFSIGSTNFSGGWQNGGAGASFAGNITANTVITLVHAQFDSQVTIRARHQTGLGSAAQTLPAGSYTVRMRSRGGNDSQPDLDGTLTYSGGGEKTYASWPNATYSSVNVTRTGSTWTITNNRTDSDDPLQEDLLSYTLTTDGSSYNVGAVSAGSTATQFVESTATTATYSAGINAVDTETFGPVNTTNAASSTLSGGDITITRSAGTTITGPDFSGTASQTSGGLAVTVTQGVGSLTTLTNQSGTGVVNYSNLSFIELRGTGMGNHTVVRYNGPNATGGGATQIFSYSQDDNPGFTLRYRGANYVSGDQGSGSTPGTPSGISANGSLAYSGFTQNGTQTRIGTRPTTYTITVTNNNSYDVVLNSDTTGISTNTTLTAGASRTLQTNGSSNSYRVHANDISTFNYAFRKSADVFQRVRITNADTDIADTELSLTNVRLATNVPSNTISVSGDKDVVSGSATSQTAPTRASTTAGVGVYGVSADNSPAVTIQMRFGDSDSDDRIETDYRFSENETDTEMLRDELFTHLETLSEFSTDTLADDIIYSISKFGKGIRFTRQDTEETSSSLLTNTFITSVSGVNYSQTQFGAAGLSSSIAAQSSGETGQTAPTIRIARGSNSSDIVITGLDVDTEAVAGFIRNEINRLDMGFIGGGTGNTITATQNTASESNVERFVVSVISDDSDVLPAGLDSETFSETTTPDNPQDSSPTVLVTLPANDQRFDSEARSVSIELSGKLDTELSASDVARRIRDGSYTNWTTSGTGANVIFTSTNPYPYNRIDNGLGTGTIDNKRWSMTVQDQDSEHAPLSNAYLSNATAAETTAGIAVRYALPTLFRLHFSDGSMQRYAFGGAFNGLVTDVDTDFYTNQGHAMPLTRIPVGDLVDTLSVAIRDNTGNRVSAEVNEDSEVAITPSQFGANALHITRTELEQQGTIAPGSRAAAIPAASPNTFSLNSTLNTMFDDERPWPTNLVHDFRNFLLMAADTELYGMDLTYSFAGQPFTSYIERQVLHLQPTKDVEQMGGLYIDVDADSESSLEIHIDPTNVSTGNFNVTRDGTPYSYSIAGDSPDYKVDIREIGRFINMRISNTGTTDYSLTGIAIGLMKGGTR